MFDWLENEGVPIGDLLVDSRLPDHSGQVLVARGSTASSQGGIKRWALEGVFRYNLSNATWQWITYPISFRHNELPKAIAVDDSGNLYAAGIFSNYYLLYRLKANSTSWEQRASLSWKDLDNPALQFTLTDLVWADGYVYGLAHTTPGESWYLFRHYPGNPNMGSEHGPSTNWTNIGETSLPTGASTADSRSLTWDGVDSIYVLQSTGYFRYRISSTIWDVLPATSGFTLSQTPALARAGNNLYIYATPQAGTTTNLFRYGAVGLPDARLKVERTAFVEPESATSLTWSQGSSYRFQIEAGKTNAWVTRPGGTWSPALPTGAPTLSYAEADFMAPDDNLYRLGATSLLRAGYHTYKAVAHVYTSEADCTECSGGGLVWGEQPLAPSARRWSPARRASWSIRGATRRPSTWSPASRLSGPGPRLPSSSRPPALLPPWSRPRASPALRWPASPWPGQRAGTASWPRAGQPG